MNDQTKPILYWLRRDLRLSDNPALDWAAEQGRPVIPVFLHDEVTEDWGAAPRWRVGLGLAAHADALESLGSRLILRRGEALATLRALIAETGADTVVWNRLYVANERARDEGVEAGLTDDGVTVKTFQSHVLFEPWKVQTGAGSYYKVYTPFWKAVRDRDPGPPISAPSELPAPSDWPETETLAEWKLGHDMRRGIDVVARYAHVGEETAQARLATFIEEKLEDYARARDMLAEDGTSGLSENLTYGEISARACWAAGQRAMQEGRSGAETFLREIVWRDFAHHLAWHTPRLTTSNWRKEWDAFPWQGDNEKAEAWRRGCTGLDVVDAAMREIYVTGRMHNRARMLVASYLTKHLMTHWRVGCDWFGDVLIDWDPANNAMGWQWAAGSGPDASPFFRIFNPETQARKFDPKGRYRDRWLESEEFYEAVPEGWHMTKGADRPDTPIVGLKEGREAALDAYRQRGDG
ncbi:Deoxyribodipyrimidine photo-lyase [Jannaschia seosinensis]|uniref:Deoxyribodipyrimidine photo-lyase n=1 Tax=Jannaschia seosinensis TaxID=313367 RepID=A0A0M7BAY5_9RHOB|nr:deoxyribodipyrimidine photo-lyase [Jannaschia seosinensis]CUH39073.1 Deoxyribodipyrimidine photo-lyase [Jannaschia seosinensis]